MFKLTATAPNRILPGKAMLCKHRRR